MIKTKILGKYNYLILKEAINKIVIPDIEIECKSKDVKYNITINNKILDREKNLIIFGNKNRLLLMKNNEYIEYFIDSTFKVIPKKFNNYKLLTIATIDIPNNFTILIGFVCFKYQYSTSYYNIFKYLNEIYNLNQKLYILIFRNQ